MGKKRLLEYDTAAGAAVYHEYDHHARTTLIHEVQDAAPFLRINQAEMHRDTATAGRLNSVSREQIRNSWWHVARIPVGVQMQWLREYGVDIFKREHWPRVQKLLNDRDWQYLRTNPGRV